MNKNKKVIFLPCNGYDLEKLISVIEGGLATANFDLKGLSGKKVLLKPNLLGAYPPELGVTTHPVFVEAIVKILQGSGAEVWIGDSSGFGHRALDVWKVAGFSDLCLRTKATMKSFENEMGVTEDGIVIAKPIYDADFVINLPKLKTHSLTLLTCAIKNLYGGVPGMQKVKFHRDCRGEDFDKVILKIADRVNVSFTIVDAIDIMEGDGPSSGSMRRLNRIVMGDDIYAIDFTIARSLGIDPYEIGYLKRALSWGRLPSEDEVDVIGKNFELEGKPLILPKTYSKGLIKNRFVRLIISLFWRNLSVRPKVDRSLCVRCGICVESCPVFAIELNRNRIPEIDNKKCVECYCCHEQCPKRAIKLDNSYLLRVVNYFTRGKCRGCC